MLENLTKGTKVVTRSTLKDTKTKGNVTKCKIKIQMSTRTYKCVILVL